MPLVPRKDETYLKERGFNYELTQASNEVHLVIHGWEFPAAYTPRVADVLIIIPPAYPMTKLDMFWTSPDIKLTATGGWPEASAEHQMYAGKNWQRWSRHTEEWRPGVDSLRTFVAAITNEINRGA